MGADAEVAAARAAAQDLLRAVGALRTHYGDTVDVSRLLADAERIPADLDLLCGPERAVRRGDLEVIPDDEYPPELFQDADDEGLGHSHASGTRSTVGASSAPTGPRGILRRRPR